MYGLARSNCKYVLQKKKVLKVSLLFGNLLSVTENDYSSFSKPWGAQEVGHMDMQQLEKCKTLRTSNVFIPIHLNIISTFSQYKNIAAAT